MISERTALQMCIRDRDIALARLGLLLGLADLLGVGDALCRQILTGLLFS